MGKKAGKEMFKKLFANSKIRVMNTDKKIQYVISLKKDNNIGIDEILDVCDTNVHNGFLDVVECVEKFDPKYSEIRKGETDQTVNYVVIRGGGSFILKDTKFGETFFSVQK